MDSAAAINASAPGNSRSLTTSITRSTVPRLGMTRTRERVPEALTIVVSRRRPAGTGRRGAALVEPKARYSVPFLAVSPRTAVRCSFSVGRVFFANAFSSASLPLRASFSNKAMVFS
jgi:hypothetical protein